MILRLHHGALELELVPELGGRVAALRHNGHEVLVPLGEQSFDPDHWPKAGAYPLMPFHNRVKNATLACGARVARLPVHPECAPHALHGMASRRPWQGSVEAPRIAVMQFDWEASPVWPWAFRAAQRFALGDDALSLHLSIENRDTVEMPAGIGWHPYITGPRNPVDNAKMIWPIRPDYLPTGQQLAHCLADRTLPTRYLSEWTRVRVNGGAKVGHALTFKMGHSGGADQSDLPQARHVTAGNNGPAFADGAGYFPPYACPTSRAWP